MMQSELLEQIKRKKSFLCVGLDVDQDRMPIDLKDEPDSFSLSVRELLKLQHPIVLPINPTSPFLRPMDCRGGNPLKK